MGIYSGYGTGIEEKMAKHTSRCTSSHHSGTVGWNSGFYGRWKACRQYVTTGRDQSKNKAATTSLLATYMKVTVFVE
jgi:hypothetical protein